MNGAGLTGFYTAAQLGGRYAVSEARLSAYARRGNLSMRRMGGLVLYAECDVARLFPTRGARPLAVMGESPLGDGATSTRGFKTRGAHSPS